MNLAKRWPNLYPQPTTANPSYTHQYSGVRLVSRELDGRKYYKKYIPSRNMDITTLGFIHIAVGLVILAYVGYCLLNQKVWIRGKVGLTSTTFAWGSREEHPTIFILHVIVGMVIGIYMIANSFLW